MSTSLISCPTVSGPAAPGVDVRVKRMMPVRTGPDAAADRSDRFWLTDQQLSVADRNRRLAQYCRDDRSLLAM